MADTQTDELNNDGGAGDAPPSRRRFLKAAAATGAAGAVWAQPVIRGIPAYAADARSVTGSSMNNYLFWSPMRDNWDNNTSPMLTQNPDLAMGTCMYIATYMLMDPNLSDDLTIMAVGHPDGPMLVRSGCNAMDANPFPAEITLEPQTGCMFTNVSIMLGGMMGGPPTGADLGGWVLVDMGRKILWNNSQGNTTYVDDNGMTMTLGFSNYAMAFVVFGVQCM